MDVKAQRRMASEILKVGENKVWIDPERIADVSGAITKDDVRRFIDSGAICARHSPGTSRVRARVIDEQKKKGRRLGHGKRKGSQGARNPKKTTWVTKIRALRKELTTLKEKQKITVSEYRKLYRQASAGVFRNKSNLKLHIKKMKE